MGDHSHLNLLYWKRLKLVVVVKKKKDTENEDMSNPYGDKIFEELINIVPHVPGEGTKGRTNRRQLEKAAREKETSSSTSTKRGGGSARGSARGGGKRGGPPKKRKPKGP